jgi:hypothetical protein
VNTDVVCWDEDSNFVVDSNTYIDSKYSSRYKYTVSWIKILIQYFR